MNIKEDLRIIVVVYIIYLKEQDLFKKDYYHDFKTKAFGHTEWRNS